MNDVTQGEVSRETVAEYWRRKYAGGHAERWPWDCVVSFVTRYAPEYPDRSDVRILELGAGTGNNAWFCAVEGYEYQGIEQDEIALHYAKNRSHILRDENCLRLGSFLSPLPWKDGTFDLVFERAALTYCPLDRIDGVLAEVRRVVKPGGYFLTTPYSILHTNPDPHMNLWSLSDVDRHFGKVDSGWKIVNFDCVQSMNRVPHGGASVYWQIVVQKL